MTVAQELRAINMLSAEAIQTAREKYQGHYYFILSISKGGKNVGFSMFAGYSYNERSFLSLGIVDPDVKNGDEVVLVWGEEGGGTKKATVERHKQLEIRATVSPAPYAKEVRESYASGWRTQQS